MVAQYRVGLPVGYSARRMAAGLVRAATDAGTAASRFPAHVLDSTTRLLSSVGTGDGPRDLVNRRG
jgi:hypothetical protein